MRTSALAISLLCISITSAPLRSQTTEKKLAFEVAVVKENHSSGDTFIGCANGATVGTMGIAAGRCRAVNIPLQALIAESYSVPILAADQYLSGLPKWAFTQGYDLEAAAADPSASRTELRQMLQNLLVDRFKLKLHEETTEVSGFALVIAKGGFKAKAVDPNAPRDPNLRINSTISGLIQFLPRRLGGPVVDRTNITGNYDLPVPFDALKDDTGPSLTTVLEERFGLTLEPIKVSTQEACD